MSPRFGAIALTCFLVGSQAGSTLGQEPQELMPLPPPDDTLKEVDVVYQSEWNSPGLASQSTAADHFWDEGHLYWGAELIVFDGASWPALNDNTMSASRYQLGWEHDSGLGVRARYLTLGHAWTLFNSPHGSHITDPDDFEYHVPYYQGSVLLGREVDNLNFDFYKRFTLGENEILLGTGLTTVRNIERLQHVFDETPPDGDYAYSYSDDALKGVGAGIVGELRRPVFVRDTTVVSFLLDGRTSYVPVDAETQSDVFNASAEDDLWIHEARIGVELLKRLQSFTFVLRGQYEVQEWDSELADNRGFDGVSFSVGLGW